MGWLSLVIGATLGAASACAKSWADGDFNGDAAVDGADFNIWLTNRFLPVQAAAAENDIQGKVYVKFMVRSNGEIDLECVYERENGSKYLEIEAIRVVKMMPNWNPAELNGKLVDMVFNLPILFKLQ